jgi:glutaredoxin
MYVLIGKEKCDQCNILENLLDEKGIRHHCLVMLEMPHKTMTYLKKNCRSYPMVLSVNKFSTFTETLECFNKIWIIFTYCIYVMIVFEKKKSVEVQAV